MDKIDICIPYIGSGIEYLRYQFKNFFSLAESPENINFILACHTEEDKALAETLPYKDKIKEVIVTPRWESTNPWVASANHSKSINALVSASTAEYTLLADYDIYFLKKNWDTYLLNELIQKGNNLTGVEYARMNYQFKFEKKLSWLSNVKLLKYQQMPNATLMFFGKRFKSCLDNKLTTFDSYLENNGLPFEFVVTKERARINNMELGDMLWLDSCSEIPEIISRNALKYSSFRLSIEDANAFFGYNSFSLLHSEIYLNHENEPLLAHFKKGSAKTKSKDAFSNFCTKVDNYLVD